VSLTCTVVRSSANPASENKQSIIQSWRPALTRKNMFFIRRCQAMFINKSGSFVEKPVKKRKNGKLFALTDESRFIKKSLVKSI